MGSLNIIVDTTSDGNFSAMIEGMPDTLTTHGNDEIAVYRLIRKHGKSLGIEIKVTDAAKEMAIAIRMS